MRSSGSQDGASTAAPAAASAPVHAASAPARKQKKPKAAAKPTKPKGARSAPPKRTGMSGLDAAARVLADSGKPMRCAEIVERIFARRLWKSTGKTPGATLNAAMLREIGARKKDSRFRKAGRGLFASTGKGR